MELLALFNNEGRKISGKCRGVNYKTDEEKDALIASGYIEVSQEDFDLYCMQKGGENNLGYIRDPGTGKPVSAPAHVPTNEETATILFNECQADLKEIDAQIVNAIILKDSELIDELRQERDDRIAEYETALDELEGGE